MHACMACVRARACGAWACLHVVAELALYRLQLAPSLLSSSAASIGLRRWERPMHQLRVPLARMRARALPLPMAHGLAWLGLAGAGLPKRLGVRQASFFLPCALTDPNMARRSGRCALRAWRENGTDN